jgi:hypothetical protein
VLGLLGAAAAIAVQPALAGLSKGRWLDETRRLTLLASCFGSSTKAKLE